MSLRYRLNRLLERALPASLSTALRYRAHALRASVRRDTSAAGEGDYLSEIFARLHITIGYAVDIAAGDGVNQSCTLPLFRAGWTGLAVECDSEKFAQLTYAYRAFHGVQKANTVVTPNTVVALLQAYRVPHTFTFLNLDIDSYDLFVADALLADFRPHVISMEVNEVIPPPVSFAVRYDPGFSWDGSRFFGCSLAAATACLARHGYHLAGLQYNNAVFVQHGIPPIGADEAYRIGYRDKADRLEIFPWNAPWDDLLAMQPEEVVETLHARFEAHRGNYLLSVAE